MSLDEEDIHTGHGSSSSSLAPTPQLPSHRPPPISPIPFSALVHKMSLPRSNYDPRRVCLNPFPEITLGKHRRAMGIYLAGALVCFRIKRSQSLHWTDIFSLLSQIGHFWMLQFYPRTPSHHGDRQTRRLLSTSPLLTGFRASAPCSDIWLSISSIKIELEAIKRLEIQQLCGEHGYSFSSDSHSWREALLAVWYVYRRLS